MCFGNLHRFEVFVASALFGAIQLSLFLARALLGEVALKFHNDAESLLFPFGDLWGLAFLSLPRRLTGRDLPLLVSDDLFPCGTTIVDIILPNISVRQTLAHLDFAIELHERRSG